VLTALICAGSSVGCRASLHDPVRSAYQPVQREDLPVLVVLDGIRGVRDVHVGVVVVRTYRRPQESSAVRAALCQPCRQAQG